MSGRYTKLIENTLPSMLPPEDCLEASVIKSMKYSLLAGGKRVRPELLLSFCDVLGGNVENALPYACAIEMIHTYSLIHDDLPCMDNDELRRGKPSNHVIFGDDVALLAGDALQALAFDIMLSDTALKNNGINGARAARVLANACGAVGMVGGQIIDLETEGKSPSQKIILQMYAKKTGALIKAACVMGALLADASDDMIHFVEIYADKIGLAFQIVDDILDIESDTQILGKPVGSDAENEKVNYVTTLGSEQGRMLVETLTREACEALDFINADTSHLRQLANSLSHRVR